MQANEPCSMALGLCSRAARFSAAPGLAAITGPSGRAQLQRDSICYYSQSFAKFCSAYENSFN